MANFVALQIKSGRLSVAAFASLLLLFYCGTGVNAAFPTQDDPNADQGAADAESVELPADLPELLQQWKILEQKLIDKEAEFNAATEAVDPNDEADSKANELRQQYTEMVDEAKQLVSQIRSAAIDAFEKNPDDEANTKLLIGLIMNDAETGNDNDAIMLGDRLVASGVDSALLEKAARSDRLSLNSKELLEELFLRSNQAKADTLPQVRIVTNKGEMTLELFEDEAPNTVANFISLIEDGFYDGLKFHRVVEGFVAQGGDPNGDGSGGPGYTIACECVLPEARRHFVGSLSMANTGVKDTGGSQFFLCLDRTERLDGRHTVFGRIISGIEVLDQLSRNNTGTEPIPGTDTDVIEKMEVIRKREHPYEPEKIGETDTDEGGGTSDKPPAQPESLSSGDDESGSTVESGGEDASSDGTDAQATDEESDSGSGSDSSGG